MKTVVVGNGPSVLGCGLGKAIDSFENVVRINSFATYGFEDDCGTKTDTWVVNLDPAKEMINELYCCDYLLAINDGTGFRRSLLEKLRHLANARSRAAYASTPLRYRALKQELGSAPSTGICTIDYYLQTEYRVAVAGFDCFSNCDEHHYFDKTRHKDHPHDGGKEKKWLDGKLATGRLVDLHSLSQAELMKILEVSL